MKPQSQTPQDVMETTETETTVSEEENAYGYEKHEPSRRRDSLTSSRRDSMASTSRRDSIASSSRRSSRGSSPTTPRRVSNPDGTPTTPRTPRRSSLKGSSGREFRRHSLTFSNNVTVATITPTSDMAKKKLLWFEDKDYQKMQRKIHLIAEKAKQDSSKYCTRGLEAIMRRDSETRRYAAWDVVLDEQEYQKEAAVYDDDALSNSYREACEESRAEATLRALQDEKAIADYLADTRTYCRRMSSEF